jgi:hypothetical protein
VVARAEDFARRHSVVVCGGMFLAGVALARFLKASQPQHARYAEGVYSSAAPPTEWQSGQAVQVGI